MPIWFKMKTKTIRTKKDYFMSFCVVTHNKMNVRNIMACFTNFYDIGCCLCV